MPITLKFRAGVEAAEITVTLVNDNVTETDETISLTLQENPGYIVGSPDIATVTITETTYREITAKTDVPLTFKTLRRKMVRL
ncbi:MAG: hypothetical protein PHU78_09265 [Heliobacteriaceae bacterium]|nr:hypothetical protein [Heliobacteriaceae bacterium]